MHYLSLIIVTPNHLADLLTFSDRILCLTYVCWHRREDALSLTDR